MLTTMTQRLKYYSDNNVITDQESKAAVLLLLHGDPHNPLIILTRRASHLKNHAGEVAFPGGMKESHDKDLLATALRETEEEIGLPSSAVNFLGRLPADSPRTNNIRVSPFMGWIDSPCSLNPNPSEIDAVFHLPLRFLMHADHYQYFYLKEGKIRLPYVMYQNYKIWGFTLKVMVDMLNNLLDANIQLRYPSWDEFNNLGYQ
jgi:8-oxo-dGTP pyrophosphatase MutT (NUDIX family)